MPNFFRNRTGHHPTCNGLAPSFPTVALSTSLPKLKKEQRLKLGPKFRDAGLLFCGPKGRPLNPSNIRNRDHLPRLVRLGLPRTRPHDLRHFHATFLTANGVDIRTSADRLGHRDPGFMLRTYAHANAKAQERAAEVANELLMKTRQSRQ